MGEEEAVCCPKFDPEPWDGIVHEWKDRLFLTGALPQFLHMPLPGPLNKEIGKLWKLAGDLGSAPDMKDFLLLMYDPSPWKSELYLSVTKTHADAPIVAMTGTFVSKVFDGPYNAVPRYIKEMEEYLESTGKKAVKYFFYYTTCPKCAKKYGHNYIVAFAEAKPNE